MLVEVKSSGERVSISIDGRELGRGVRYPEAIALLDGAYTNEIGALLDELRQRSWHWSRPPGRWSAWAS